MMAAMPAITTSRFITAASMGRRTLRPGRPPAVRRAHVAPPSSVRTMRTRLAGRQPLRALDDDEIALVERSLDQNGALAPADEPHLDRLDDVAVDAPDLQGALGELERQLGHDGQRLARQLQADGEGRAGAEAVLRVRDRHLDARRPAGLDDAAVDGGDAALEAPAGRGGRAGGHGHAGVDPAEQRLGQLELDQQHAAVVEARDRDIAVDPVADIGLGQPGDAVERRADGPLAQLLARSLELDAGNLGRRFGLVEPGLRRGAGVLKLPVAVANPLGLDKPRPGQLDGQPLVRVVEAQQNVAGGVPLASVQRRLHDGALGLRPQRHRALRATGSHRLENQVVIGDAYGRGDDGDAGLAAGRGAPHPLGPGCQDRLADDRLNGLAIVPQQTGRNDKARRRHDLLPCLHPSRHAAQRPPRRSDWWTHIARSSPASAPMHPIAAEPRLPSRLSRRPSRR